jgi:hypothetical protein
MTSIGNTLDEWGTMMTTAEFWAVFAIAATVVGFLLAAGLMLTDFDLVRMGNCFNANNLNAYVLFNILLFFVFDGLLAIGEIFNYFDSKKRGVPHKRSQLFWFTVITLGLGSVGLILVKNSCG